MSAGLIFNMEKSKPIYVSLTSIYQNQKELLATLESVVRQSISPTTIFLYLSEEPYLIDTGFKNREITYVPLRQYVENHPIICVTFVPNEGPFRKLLPLLKQKWNEDCIIITIDDDTVYEISLVMNLVRDYYAQRCVINYRGFTPNITDIRELTYENRLVLMQKRHPYNFPTGKGGILYSPEFFKKTGELIFNKEIYMNCCKTADDVWFMLIRVLNGVDCYLDEKVYMDKDNTKSERALFLKYNQNLNNTIQIKNTIMKIGGRLPHNIIHLEGVVGGRLPPRLPLPQYPAPPPHLSHSV